MERVILWSKENNQNAGELSRALSKELNVLTEVLSEQEALVRIAQLGDRESSVESATLFLAVDDTISINVAMEICRNASSFSGHFGAFSFQNGNEIAAFPQIDAATIIDGIAPSQSWVCSAVVINHEICEGIGDALTMNEAIVRMAIRALGNDGDLDLSLGLIDTTENISNYESSFSNEICSMLLEFTLNVVNVEELFPTHNWNTFEAESAAACYHTLAAKFISFEDHHRAKECLAEGDRLEDSPRSLALKGLIALKEGEVLTAVANMVSSLQEYEKRKSDSSTHYLSFAPKNLEMINTSLQSGLAALNKKENDSAAGHFTEAVFEFDAFYSDCGLEQPKVQ